jgi:dinuclear metal center YbgI/SA1388 family protein
MPLQRTIRLIESFAPRSLAESWDNVGLLIEAPYPRKGNRIFLTIDLTEKVLDEAIEDPSVSVIVSYHPPLFSSIKRLNMGDPKQRIALKCIGSGISVYSPHSALDSCDDGINDWLAAGLGNGVTTPIKPIVLDGQPKCGIGRFHTLTDAVSLEEITIRIKKYLGLTHVRLATCSSITSIKTVAICAGSGGSVIGGTRADLYFTGEMGHHDVLAALDNKANVILCEHTNTERGYLEQILKPKLLSLFKKEGVEIDVVCSKLDADPLVIV